MAFYEAVFSGMASDGVCVFRIFQAHFASRSLTTEAPQNWKSKRYFILIGNSSSVTKVVVFLLCSLDLSVVTSLAIIAVVAVAPLTGSHVLATVVIVIRCAVSSDRHDRHILIKVETL